MIEDLTTACEDDMPSSSKQLRFSEPEGSSCLNCETLRQEVGDLKKQLKLLEAQNSRQKRQLNARVQFWRNVSKNSRQSSEKDAALARSVSKF